MTMHPDGELGVIHPSPALHQQGAGAVLPVEQEDTPTPITNRGEEVEEVDTY